MPAVNFSVTWPDGEVVKYYCPSTIILRSFKEGEVLSQEEFKLKITQTLAMASERVRQKFGYYCSAAAAEQDKIDQKLAELGKGEVVGNVTLTHFN